MFCTFFCVLFANLCVIKNTCNSSEKKNIRKKCVNRVQERFGDLTKKFSDLIRQAFSDMEHISSFSTVVGSGGVLISDAETAKENVRYLLSSYRAIKLLDIPQVIILYSVFFFKNRIYVV